MTRLVQLIAEKGTNIRQLSRDSGISERTVYRHVRGETKPDIDQAAAYARALGVTIEELREVAA